MMRKLLITALALVMTGCATHGSGQTTVNGTIKLPNGAPSVGSTVYLLRVSPANQELMEQAISRPGRHKALPHLHDKAASAVTNPQGVFSVANVDNGQYFLIIAPGDVNATSIAKQITVSSTTGRFNLVLSRAPL